MRLGHLLLIAVTAFAAGCTSAKTTNTARTAMEQLLVSGAVDQSLDKVDFRPFQGYAVLLDDKYVDCVDKGYVVGSVRHRLLAAGSHLVDTRDEADIVVELRTGAVGTDTAESFVGVPEITLPGMITLPEVRLLTRTSQSGTAKIGMVAYDAQSNQALGLGGMSLARSDDNNWYVAGVGPFQEGTVRSEVNRLTSGEAAIYRPSYTAKVAFVSPAATPEEPEIRFTAGEEASE